MSGSIKDGLTKKESFNPSDSRPKVCPQTERLKPNDPMIKRSVKLSQK
jgi:hypothetical protein